MTADDFTEAARAEAERRWTRGQADGRPLSAYARMNRRIGFEIGALWAAAQEPTDAEVEAAAKALWAEIWLNPELHPWDTEATEAERASCRREARAALSAARAARRVEENQ